MDATRQAFLDELYAHGRAYDEARPDRLQRLRNVEPETAELLGVLVRAWARRACSRSAPPTASRRSGSATRPRPSAASVLSLEIEAERTAQALDNLTQAGVKDAVELRTQDAAEALASFADEAFDLIFLDAERTEYARYWPELIRVLRRRGLLVVDNTLSHAKELVDFSELVYAEEGVTSTLVTVGAGVLLIVKSP